MSKLKIAIVCSALPPRMDGIGDHSSGLGGALAEWADVTLHTAIGFTPDQIPGASIAQNFDIKPRRAIAGLVKPITLAAPDWLIVQYNPFCFGKRGINPFLYPALRRVRENLPGMKIAVMVHERWMHTSTLKYAVMSLIQRQQFRAITGLADLTLFSTGPWADEYKKKFPERKCVHMPVGSNLPWIPTDRAALRSELGFDQNTVVLGSFGGNHPSRMFELLAKAGHRLKSLRRDVRILCLGAAGPAIRQMMPTLPLVDLGSLPAADVSRNLQAIDIYASPFVDGVSTRRGSFFAGIQHGLATITTRSYHSDSDMMSYEGTAFFAPMTGDDEGFVQAVEQLAGDVDLRQATGTRAKVCFDEKYALPVLANRWRALLQGHDGLTGSASHDALDRACAGRDLFRMTNFASRR